jgi:hypothetical protein
MDVKGTHILNCIHSSGDKIRRHNLIRDYWFELAKAGGLNPEKEKRGLCRGNERPADVYIRDQPTGKLGTVIDICITNPVQQSYLDSNLPADPERATNDACERKFGKYQRAGLDMDRYCFLPLVWDTHGGWSDRSVSQLRRLSKAVNARNTAEDEAYNRHTRQHVSVLLTRGTASAIMNKYPVCENAAITGFL